MKDEFATAEEIECGQLLGKVERFMQRNQHQSADDPQTRRNRGASQAQSISDVLVEPARC